MASRGRDGGHELYYQGTVPANTVLFSPQGTINDACVYQEYLTSHNDVSVVKIETEGPSRPKSHFKSCTLSSSDTIMLLSEWSLVI